jgi:ATP-binding cassette, subfamily C, bacterial CydC
MRHPAIRLLKLAAPFARAMVLAVLLGVATIGSSIGLMTTSAYLISKASLRPSIAELQVAIVGVRFFGISRGILRYLERYVSHQVTFRLLRRLRVWFYEALEPLAPARLLQFRSGDLLARIVGDIATLENFYLRVIAPPAVALVTALLAGAVLAYFDPRIAGWWLLLFSLAGAGVPLLAQRLGQRPGKRLVEVQAALKSTLVDGVQGVADLLAFGQDGLYANRACALGREMSALQGRMASVSGLHTALTGLLMNLGVLVVLVVAIPLVSSGRLDGVYLALLVLAVVSSFEAVLPLPQAFQYLENSLVAADRLFAIVDAEPAVIDSASALPSPQDFDLQVDGLRFSYGDSGPPALDGVSFSVGRGEQVAVVGPSGAGKSTLVHLLVRFWEYEEGQILLGGRDMRAYSQEDVRRAISVVSQRTSLFNATVRDNLLLARPEATEAEMVDAARRAHIHSFLESLPKGYDTWIGEQGLRLSGGQRQRLAIARAILKDAPILILDEATANLDALTERDLLTELQDLAVGRTTLMISHRLVGLDSADEILVLRAGRIVERGRHDELVQLGGLYRRMWDLQRQFFDDAGAGSF